MLLATETYAAAGVDETLNLATIADFNSLISRSQEALTPVFSLTDAQMKAVGQVLGKFRASRDAFHSEFNDLANRVHTMTTPADTVPSLTDAAS